MENKVEKVIEKDCKELKFFKKITALPYLLVLLALLMPLANVSCSVSDSEPKSILDVSLYDAAIGVNLDESLDSSAAVKLHDLIDKNKATQTKLHSVIPNFPKMEPMPFLWGICIAVLLAAVFALFTPLGSLTMGMLAMFSSWAFLTQLAHICDAFGLPILKLEPGIGIYAASTLILIGTAMNLASIIRPIVAEFKAKKK